MLVVAVAGAALACRLVSAMIVSLGRWWLGTARRSSAGSFRSTSMCSHTKPHTYESNVGGCQRTMADKISLFSEGKWLL